MTQRHVAVVAGAGGAGAATALALSASGFHVVVLDSRLEPAQTVVDSVVAAGGSGQARAIDLLDTDAVVALREELVAQLGRVDVLVHLVGGWRGSASLDLASVDNWTALHPPVVGTLATLTAVFGEVVRSAPAGRVFMVTSTAAAQPTAGNIAYSAAKRAAEAWMEGVAAYFEGSTASSVTVAVKALLTDRMAADDPAKTWPGYTHVRDLAYAITSACVAPIGNGERLDLTTGAPA